MNILKKCKQRVICYTICLLASVVIIFLATRGRENINDTVIFMCFALSFSVGLILKNKKQLELNRRTFILSFILDIVFFVQVSFFEFSGAKCFWNINKTFIHKLFVLTVLVISFVTIFVALYIIMQKLLDDNIQKNTVSKKHIYSLAIIAESLFFLLSTYPGIFLRDDVEKVYTEVITNNWDAWHTFGFEVFVKLCTSIYESPYSVNVVQTIMWILLNMYILNFLDKINPTTARLYTYVVCFSISPFLYLEMMVKDIVFAMGILAVTVVFFKVLYYLRMERSDMIYLAIYANFATLCRHGGNIPVFVTYIILIIYLIHTKNKELLREICSVFLVNIGVFIFVNYILFNMLNVVPNNPAVKYGTPVAMVGAAVYYEVDMDEEDIAIIENLMPIEKWKECYNKYVVDDIARHWGKIGEDGFRLYNLVYYDDYGKDIIKLNAKLLIRHPKVYLKALFDMNSLVWEINTPHDTQSGGIAGAQESDKIRYSLAYVVSSNVSQFYRSLPILKALTLRGGFSIFIILLSGCVLYIKNKRLILSLLPIVIVNLLLLITIPMQDPRYILPTIECAIFILSIVFSKSISMQKSY